MKQSQQLRTSLQTRQLPLLLGRLRMADWIEMPESDFAKEIETIEKDPLFKKLIFTEEQGEGGAIRRQKWPRSRLLSGFYEMNESVLAGGERVQVEESL